MFECRDVRLSHLSAVAVMIALVGAMFVAMGSISGHTGTGVHIDFDDGDAIVKAGTKVEASINGLGDNPDPAASTTDWTVPLGLLIEIDAGEDDYGRKQNGIASVMIDTTGATAGDYTITAVYDGKSYTKSLQIGDAGRGVGSVEVKLGQRIAVGDNIDRDSDGSNDTDNAAGVDVAAETGTTSSTDTVNVIVETQNSLGNVSNDNDVDTIILFVDAKGTAVSGRTGNLVTPETLMDNSVRVDEDPDSDTEEAMASHHFTVGASEVAVIEVYAIVIGSSGTATSERLTLNFTGEATTISLGDASDALKPDGDAYVPLDNKGTDDEADDDPAKEGGIVFEVSGTDKGGSTVNLKTTDITAPRIMDSDDKDVTAKFDMPGTMVGTKDNKVVVRVGSGETKVAAGEYTVEVALASDATAKATASFHVSGGAANVALETESMEVTVDQALIEVTAMVTDSAGVRVADGTPVLFSASGNKAVLEEIEPDGGHKTTGGSVTAKFFVIGAGTSKVLVISGTDADALTITVTGDEEAEAMPEEEASVGCLSNLAGFATWACGVESSASEIFGLVSGRGATALHLWNGSAWVRYSVVDGTMVPGSSDFMVAENDILYISN